MRQKLIALISLVLVMVLFTSCESASVLFGLTISEKKVNTFLEDSRPAMVYLFSEEENKDAGESCLDANLKAAITAACYVSRNNDEMINVNGTYVIPAENMDNELPKLFLEPDITGLKVNDLIYRDDSDNYRFTEGEKISYEITDSFYGYIGSEPTTITVRYACGNEERTVKYTIFDGDESPYDIQVSDITME